MLTYEEFTEELVQMLPDLLPGDLKARGISVEPLVTTNDQHRDVLTPSGAPEGLSGKPVMYLDDAYKQYQAEDLSMEQVCGRIAGALAESMNHIPDVNGIENQIKPENLFCCMINLQGNREYLKNIPHLVLGDLAAVYKIHVQDDRMGHGTVTISRQLMERMGLNDEKLFVTAYDNMTGSIPFIVERIEDSLTMDPEEHVGPKTFDDLSDMPTDSMMYVISNREKYWGSGVLLMRDNLDKLSEHLNASLILIPSSVHEIIAVPDKDSELMKTCIAMVRDVNETAVDPKERLSDSIYRYDRDRRALEMYSQDGDIRDIKLEVSADDREQVKVKSAER